MPYDITYMWNLKYGTNELIYKTEADSQMQRSDVWLPRGWGRERDGLGIWGWFSSVQFSHSVMSNSLWPHESQHARPPCPSPTPGVHSNLRPSSRWCHPAISSSVVPFSSCPQPLPASGSFPVSQLFAWGGQSIGVSALELGLVDASYYIEHG